MTTLVVSFEGGPLDGESRAFSYMPCGVFEIGRDLYDLRYGDDGLFYVWRDLRELVAFHDGPRDRHDAIPRECGDR